MRALDPTTAGTVVNAHDGVGLYYEAFGPADARRTIVLLPTWSLVHSRVWKMQVPYLVQRGHRVITFDGRGNGRSCRPDAGYATDDFVRDTQTVIDHLRVGSAVLIGFSAGARWAIQFAAQHPDLVEQLVLIAPATFMDGSPRVGLTRFTEAPPDRDGWNKYNAVHWREDYRDFVRWFAAQIFTEPHSTKGRDDIDSWACDTTHEMLTQTVLDSANPRMGEYWRAVDCPVLIVHGSHDAVIAIANSRDMQARRPGTHLAVLDDSGHAPHIRDAVRTNLITGAFLETHAPVVRGERRVHARA